MTLWRERGQANMHSPPNLKRQFSGHEALIGPHLQEHRVLRHRFIFAF
jgi:hypothetical protein